MELVNCDVHYHADSCFLKWGGGWRVIGKFLVYSPAFAPENLLCSSKFCVAFIYNTVWYNYFSLEPLFWLSHYNVEGKKKPPHYDLKEANKVF
jgi:hypothetical protein